jgi:hypothetical protein
MSLKKITRDGVYRMSLADYHGQPCDGPSISSSGLRTIFQKSPAHFWSTSSLNPEAEPQEDSAAFVLGRAAHHLLLGEDDFSTLFIARPETLKGEPWHGNRTVCKAWLSEQDLAGRTVLMPSDIKAIRGMARSLSAHPLVKAGILNGEIEQSLIVKDKKTGLYLKSRPDVIPNDSGDFADLKTSSVFGPELDKEIGKYGYDMQAALVAMNYREVFEGRLLQSFSFVFVETKAPHCVEVLTLKSEDIEEAEKDLRAAIDTFAYCLRTGDWFGPGGTQRDARFAHIPDWVSRDRAFRRDELRREITPPVMQTTPKYTAAEYFAAG